MKSQIIMVLTNRVVRIQVIIFLSIVLIFSFLRLYELNHQYQIMNEYTLTNIKIHEQSKNSLLMDSKMSQRELREDEKLFVEIDNAYIDAGNAFQNRDYRKYIQLMIKAGELEDSIREKYRITITNKNTLGSTASKNGILFKKKIQQSMMHYQQLESKNFDDKKVMNELIGITAVQSFLPLLDYKIPNIFFLPFLFLFTLVMSNSIFLSDSKHRSLLNAKPISNFRYSIQKMSSKWIVISFVQFVAFLIYFGMISIKNGIGDFTLKTVIFENDTPITISYFSLFLIILCFVMLLNLLIVSLCSLLNQLFRNQILTFLFGIIVIFLETVMKVLNIEMPYIGFIPSSYFSFGPVIYGVKNEFYLNAHLSMLQGVLVLVITSVIWFIFSIGIMTLKEKRERYEKFSSIKLDYNYLVSTGYFIKLPVIIFVLFVLLIGYNKWVPTETPQKVLNTQFMMMDDLMALIAKDYSIPSNVREESEMQIAQIYQNLSEENFSYKKPVTSKNYCPFIQNALGILNTLKTLLPNYMDKLPDISKLEDEKIILEYLSERNQVYLHYKTSYVVIKISLYFLAIGGFLFLYILMVANFHKRKLSHKSLLKALPISMARLNKDEWFYTLGLFYFLPVIIVLIGISLYCLAVGVNFFNYPILITTSEGTRIYSAYHMLLISIFYPVVSTYICYILEKIFVLLFKDEILSIICLLTLIGTCTIFCLFNTPFGMMIVLPMIQNNQSLTIGFLLLTTCMLLTFYVTNYLFIKFFRYKIVFMEE